jgi:hypothetical protein
VLSDEPNKIHNKVRLIYMNYKDMTQEQKDMRQKVWERVLEPFCPSYKVQDEEEGEIDFGKPCDQGCPCDRCHYDSALQIKYIKLMKEEGLPLTEEEEQKLSEHEMVEALERQQEEEAEEKFHEWNRREQNRPISEYDDMGDCFGFND